MSDKNINQTLTERGQSYGSYAKGSEISQALKDVAISSPSWQSMTPYQKQSISFICDKMSRLLNGDPNHEDTWHDIAGYANLARNNILGLPDSGTVDEARQEIDAINAALNPKRKGWPR